MRQSVTKAGAFTVAAMALWISVAGAETLYDRLGLAEYVEAEAYRPESAWEERLRKLEQFRPPILLPADRELVVQAPAALTGLEGVSLNVLEGRYLQPPFRWGRGQSADTAPVSVKLVIFASEQEALKYAVLRSYDSMHPLARRSNWQQPESDFMATGGLNFISYLAGRPHSFFIGSYKNLGFHIVKNRRNAGIDEDATDRLMERTLSFLRDLFEPGDDDKPVHMIQLRPVAAGDEIVLEWRFAIKGPIPLRKAEEYWVKFGTDAGALSLDGEERVILRPGGAAYTLHACVVNQATGAAYYQEWKFPAP